MEAVKVLLIDGPAAGRRVEVPGGDRHFIVPIKPTVRFAYRIAPLRTFIGDGEWMIGIPEDWPDENSTERAVTWLIENCRSEDELQAS